MNFIDLTLWKLNVVKLNLILAIYWVLNWFESCNYNFESYCSEATHHNGLMTYKDNKDVLWAWFTDDISFPLNILYAISLTLTLTLTLNQLKLN